jgi:transposase
VEPTAGVEPATYGLRNCPAGNVKKRLSLAESVAPIYFRWVLILAAWILKTRCRNPAARKLQLWAAEVEKRRGKGVATVALARKLAGILFALWRDGTEFKSC